MNKELKQLLESATIRALIGAKNPEPPQEKQKPKGARLIDANELDTEFERACPQECGICSIPCNDTCCPLVGDASTVNAIIIPEGATNGGMIRTMFPKWKIIEHELAFRIYPYGNDSAYFFFDKKWWNAPYKEP